MSAISQVSPSSSNVVFSERRAAIRHYVPASLSIILGRGEGTLVDISESGARVRHSTSVRLGSPVRLSFEWDKQRFTATGSVLSSRVISLGPAVGTATRFESRLRFSNLSPEAVAALNEIIKSFRSHDLHTWMANLCGSWKGEARSQGAASFIRCRRRYSRWERKWTRDSRQPEDGFTVPATIDESELVLLCRMWDDSDDDGRAVLRSTARASVESVLW